MARSPEALRRYREWIKLIFETPHRACEMQPLHVEYVRFVDRLFRNLAAETAAFDDEQMKRGLEYIFYTRNSDAPWAIMGNCCPLEERLACLRAMASVYGDCFETRCEPTLRHIDEPCQRGIASTCFMLWEGSALLHWEDGRDAVLHVLTAGLDSPNPACQESALHGLGHLAHEEPRVPAIIGGYLDRRGRTARPELVGYAHAASRGCIQ